MLDDTLPTQPVKRQTLAEQMATTIKELILANKLQSGASLPTEPNLAKQFGVSRAVVRDATRILMAWGLVEVKHGRGVFVTAAQNEAFGDALLLTLQRTKATVWDVEHFEQIIFPEVVALATQQATDEEVLHIQHLTDNCISEYRDYLTRWWQQKGNIPETNTEQMRLPYQKLQEAIFTATHNRVFQQLALPLIRLRNLRHWRDSKDDTLEELIQREADALNVVLAALKSRDPGQARATVAALMQLPPEAVTAMQQTPVGEIPQISITSKGVGS